MSGGTRMVGPAARLFDRSVAGLGLENQGYVRNSRIATSTSSRRSINR